MSELRIKKIPDTAKDYFKYNVKTDTFTALKDISNTIKKGDKFSSYYLMNDFKES